MKKEVRLEEIKKIELEMLVAFDDFCIKKNLRYSLGGGTLLGAVRHKGFIPWDDDIDVMMPRADYEIFVSEFNNSEYNKTMELKAFEIDKTYKYPFAKICDKNTILLEESVEQVLGIYIDVFPIDGFDLNWKKVFRKYNLLKTKLNFHLCPSSSSRIKKFIKTIYLKFSSSEKLQEKIKKLVSKCDYETSEFRGVIIGTYGKKEIYDAFVFEDYVKLPFENKEFSCLKEYDKYLTQHYGDYMKLPPKEKQISPHRNTVYFK